MVRLTSSDQYRICASCLGPMSRLPKLDAWMCDRCSGTQYLLPGEWRQPTAADDDDVIYQEETAGE